MATAEFAAEGDAAAAETDAATASALDSAWRFATDLAARRGDGAHKAVAANAATIGSFMIAMCARSRHDSPQTVKRCRVGIKS